MKRIVSWWLIAAILFAPAVVQAQTPAQKPSGWEFFVVPALVAVHEHGHMVPKLALDLGIARAWYNGRRATTFGLAFGFDSHLEFGPIVVVGDVLWHVSPKVSAGINGMAYADFSAERWKAVGVGAGPKWMFEVDPRGVHVGGSVNAVLQIGHLGDLQPGVIVELEMAIDFDLFKVKRKPSNEM